MVVHNYLVFCFVSLRGGSGAQIQSTSVAWPSCVVWAVSSKISIETKIIIKSSSAFYLQLVMTRQILSEDFLRVLYKISDH